MKSSEEDYNVTQEESWNGGGDKLMGIYMSV